MNAPPPPPPKQIPIVCPGHTRPLAELQYVTVQDESTNTKNTNNNNKTSTSTTFLLSACHDRMPMMRDATTGDWIGTWAGHKGAVWSCQVDATGSLAATASGDFSVRVWDAITGQSLLELPHQHIVKTCVFSPSSTLLATGGKEALVRVYDLPQLLLSNHNNNNENENTTKVKPEPILTVKQDSPITKLAWLSDTQLLAACQNGKIYLWDITTSGGPQLLYTFDTKAGAEIRDMEVRTIVVDNDNDITGGSQTILTVAAGTKVYFFDTSTHQLVREFVMPIHFKEEGGCTLHPSGTKFVAGGSDLWVRVFDFATGTELECHKGHHGPIRCVRYSPDGTSYASGSEDGTIRLWKTDLLVEGEAAE
ncbi:WD repeat-containing protein [Nitzschia inconspicua]|uniref:WD repeat-containing protein n=1 Tax=Nitzschia inconspicua TaxID=303405 RepID=A0A9K3LBP4_9STRA|nr:WD repeat-containing protein [Nitzschia inconspicua]